MKTITHHINGELVSNKSSHYLPIYNPATGEQNAQVSIADNDTLEQAIQAAQNAFPAWAATPPLRRARIFFNYKQLLEQHKDELAQLVTQEHGKTLADAAGSVTRGIEIVEFACGAPHLLKGDYSANVGTDVDSYSLHQPLGICAGITPFNFPAMVPLWMFPLALVCGNTFLLKPSEKDPSCAMRLAELLYEAGLPKGVLNVVNGDKRVVDGLLTHPDIAAISFVGSTPVAEHIQQTAIKHGKRVQAFGGAKNHCVVMPDADINQTANAIMGAAYGSAGERCMAISAVVTVGDEMGDALIEQLHQRMATLKIGPGDQDDTEMGPLISQEHFKRVTDYIELGIEEGAKLVVDGRNVQVAEHENGFFLGPNLFDQVTTEMRIYQEEIFGPVLVILRAPDLETAIDIVSQHEYGNGTAIFTADGHTAKTYADKVKVGMVGINVPIPVPAAFHSFGGWKRSIFADIHMHGTEGIRFYTKLKTITSRWPKEHKGAEYTIPTTE